MLPLLTASGEDCVRTVRCVTTPRYNYEFRPRCAVPTTVPLVFIRLSHSRGPIHEEAALRERELSVRKYLYPCGFGVDERIQTQVSFIGRKDRIIFTDARKNLFQMFQIISLTFTQN